MLDASGGCAIRSGASAKGATGPAGEPVALCGNKARGRGQAEFAGSAGCFRLLLLANLYIVVGFGVAATMGESLGYSGFTDVCIEAYVVLQGGLFALVGGWGVVSALLGPGRVDRALQLYVGVVAAGAGLAAILGLLEKQSIEHVLLGTVRLALGPLIMVAMAAVQRQASIMHWVRHRYISHARWLYSILGVGLIASAVFGELRPLIIGWGIDPILLSVALYPGGPRSSGVRWSDLGVTLVAGILSLKRAALLAIGVGTLASMVLKAGGNVGQGRGGVLKATMRSVLPLLLFVGLVLGAVNAAPGVEARLREIPMIGGGTEPRFEVRTREQRVAVDTWSGGSVAEQVAGHGAGHRFQGGEGGTGALHNTYLTGLVLGGLLWLASVLGAVVLALWRQKASWIGVALLMAAGGAVAGNAMLSPMLWVLAGGAMAGDKAAWTR